MTFSIVARDPQTGSFGIAVTSCFFSVGALIPHVQPEIGAVATQAMVNQSFGVRGLAMLTEGMPAALVAEKLAETDEGREVRQVHLVDSSGCTGGYTGSRCPEWAGRVDGAGVSVAGNTLQDEGVAVATLVAYERSGNEPFEHRLIAALQAGEAAGGDRRGRQSAALLVRGRPGMRDIDIRVDDNAAPLDELERLLAVYTHDFLPVARLFPSGDGNHGIFDAESLADARAKRLASLAKGVSRSLATIRPSAPGQKAEDKIKQQ
jgi:uncharacterized Ntn-hydrolase superfamily protein